jgi:hypothetical protein
MTISKNDNLVPSICRIYYAPLSLIHSITQYPGNDRFDKQINILGTYRFSQLYFTPGSAELSEKQKPVDAGETFEQNLKLIFPGDQSSNNLAFDILTGRPLLLLIYYSSVFMKIMGDIGNGARLIRNVQVSPKGVNHQLEFSCTTTDPMGYISSLLHIINFQEETGGGID